MIRIRQISKEVGANCILDSADLEIQPGVITVLFGPNGSGKTTLMSILAGLVSASGGRLEFEGREDAHWVKRYATFVASGNRSLYYRLTGRDNLHYLAALKGVGSETFQKKLDEYGKVFGLEDLLDKSVQTMSVGQQKKLAITSALINASKLLILDEPSDGLDQCSKGELAKALLEAKKRNLCVVVASHDLDFISTIYDEIVLIDRGRILKHFRVENDLPVEARRQNLKDMLYE